MKNVLVVIADSLRFDDGMDLARKLFKSGYVAYDNVWAHGASTVPSFPSLWTGMDVWEHGAIRPGLRPLNRGMQSLLQDVGYDTVRLVSENPFTEWAADYYAPWSENGYNSKDAVGELMQMHLAADEPWCLIYHAMEPHWPYRSDTVLPAGYPWQTDAGPDAYRAAYRSSIDYFAQDVKELISALNPDVVILTADHGEAFNEHGSYMHTSDRMFPEQLHVPFIVRDRKRKTTNKKLMGLKELYDVIKAFGANGKRYSPKTKYVRSEDYQQGHWINAMRYGKYLVQFGPGIKHATKHTTVFFDLEKDPGALHWLPEIDRDVMAEIEAIGMCSPPVTPIGDEDEIVSDRLQGLGYI